MNTADLITSFFNNELSPDQERQFLLSVAASDSMRLGLKSHVMLDRIFTGQAQSVYVPETVKSAIFAEADAVLAQTSPRAKTSPSVPPRAGAGRSFFSSLGIGVVATVMTVAGFSAGYFTRSELSETRAPETPTVVVPNTPQDQRSVYPAPLPVSNSVDPTPGIDARQPSRATDNPGVVATRTVSSNALATRPALRSVAASSKAPAEINSDAGQKPLPESTPLLMKDAALNTTTVNATTLGSATLSATATQSDSSAASMQHLDDPKTTAPPTVSVTPPIFSKPNASQKNAARTNPEDK